MLLYTPKSFADFFSLIPYLILILLVFVFCFVLIILPSAQNPHSV